jgi:hypothetical protein
MDDSDDDAASGSDIQSGTAPSPPAQYDENHTSSTSTDSESSPISSAQSSPTSATRTAPALVSGITTITTTPLDATIDKLLVACGSAGSSKSCKDNISGASVEERAVKNKRKKDKLEGRNGVFFCLFVIYMR